MSSLTVSNILKERYRIDGFLAQGGMGAVYRAWDFSLDKSVAIKENKVVSEESKKQFEREAKILAGLHHPNLPRVTEYFTVEGRDQYLVMDLVEGESLADILQKMSRPLTRQEALAWIRQVCDALDYLHSQNPPIIHRDIKPQNIIINQQGRAMLVDFGIAKIYDPNKATTLGARGLTPGYAPIEQYGQGRTDARTDVYALGATLYALLTNGHPPPDVVERLKSSRDSLVPPSQLNHQITSETDRVILKSLEITTEKRYQAVRDFVTELEQAMSTVKDEKTGTRTIPSGSQTRTDRGVNRRKYAIISGVILLLILGGVGLMVAAVYNQPVSETPAILSTIKNAAIEIDGQTVNTEVVQPVDCGDSRRLEIKFLDADDNPIEPVDFSYNWRFEPADPYNDDKINSSNYAVNYQVPCELENQTVIIETQKDGKTFFTKSLLFDISN